MTLLEAFDSDLLAHLSSDHFATVQRDETEELLDYLGYIDFYQNADQKPTEAEVIAGIFTFRTELESTLVAGAPAPGTDLSLSEEELAFLARAGSLENEFPLHEYPLAKILEDGILCRILHFRLSALSLMETHQGNQFDHRTAQALEKLARWAQIDDLAPLLALTGDLVSFIAHFNALDAFAGSTYCGVAFFANKSDRNAEKRFKNDRGDIEAGFPLLPDRAGTEIIPLIHEATKTITVRTRKSGRSMPRETERQKLLPKSEVARLEAFEMDEVNRLFVRLIQLRLWLEGTYIGKLDSDMGPMSLEAIDHFLAVVNLEEMEEVEKKTTFVIKLNKDHWAINTRYFLGPLFAEIDVSRDYSDSLSQEIDLLAEKLDDKKEKEEFYKKLDEMIDEDLNQFEKRKHRRKTRHSRSFFRRFTRALKKIGRLVAKGIKAVLGALRKLFRMMKNGIKTLVREIKDACEKLRSVVAFVFGRRRFETGGISTHYDFDFDALTRIDGELQAADIETHVARTRDITDALTRASGFLGTVLPIILNLLTPPLGWLKAGISLVKYLLREKIDDLLPTILRVAFD